MFPRRSPRRRPLWQISLQLPLRRGVRYLAVFGNSTDGAEHALCRSATGHWQIVCLFDAGFCCRGEFVSPVAGLISCTVSHGYPPLLTPITPSIKAQECARSRFHFNISIINLCWSARRCSCICCIIWSVGAVVLSVDVMVLSHGLPSRNKQQVHHHLG